MKSGPTKTYVTERLASLLDAHGPSGDGTRGLADKMNYIVSGWDRIIRSEASAWRESLTREEWILVQAVTISHAFAMDTAGPVEDDIGSVLLCLEDTSAQDIEDQRLWASVATLLPKLRAASVASQLALVWMLLRECKRTAG